MRETEERKMEKGPWLTGRSRFQRKISEGKTVPCRQVNEDSAV